MKIIYKILEWDKELLLFLNNLGCEKYDDLWLYFSDKYSWVPIYFILALILLHLYGGVKFIKIAIFIAIGIIIADQITVFVVREYVARPRPCFEIELAQQLRIVNKGGCKGSYGFWSAHAANTFTLAIFLGNIMKKKIKYSLFLFIVWASLVAYSRVYLGVHYPSDIICGSIFGIIVGYLMYILFIKIFSKFHLTRR